MAVTRADIDFIQTGFQKIGGWCIDEAAYLTCCLLSSQSDAGRSGGAFEIGVYQGKYLSVLYHCARAFNWPTVGLDTFQWSSSDAVIASFKDVFGSISGLTLLTADSQMLQPDQILSEFGGRRPHFISVDGDHGATAVCADIAFAKSILGDGGIIAVDDFLNPRAIGVSEGTYRFFHTTNENRLLPFCYSSNKLFLADIADHNTYRQAVMEFASQMPEIQMCKEFNTLLRDNRNYVEQQLLGGPVLIL